MEASGIWLQNLHRTGETDSWRAQTKPCVHQDPEKKRIVTPQETDPGFSVSVHPAEAWVGGGLLQGRGTKCNSVAVCAWDLLKEVTIIFITSTIVWFQGKQQGRNTAIPPINWKLD